MRLTTLVLVLAGLMTTAPCLGQGAPFVRGDCDASGGTNLADAISLLSHLFGGAPAPGCRDACDFDDSGALDVGDAIGVLTYLFDDGAAPAAPFPECGIDPTSDGLSCLSFPPCPIEDPCALPHSLSVSSTLLPLTAVDTWTAPTVDVDALRAEDDAFAETESVKFRRVAATQKADLDPAEVGTWETLPDGTSLWRIKIVAPGALWTGIGMGTCRLPDGARLWVYDEAFTQLRPCESGAPASHGQRWRYPIPGETAVIEIHCPTPGDPDVHIGTVIHGYEPPLGDEDCPGECSPDVACADLGIEDIHRAFMRMYVPIDLPDCDTTGIAMCSGSLVNNTANDCRPFVLSAAHCVRNPGLVPGSTFLFNYDRPGCCEGVAPDTDTMEGATFRMSWIGGYTDDCLPVDPGGSDIALIELDDAVPLEFDARFNGWSRAIDTTDQVGTVHQPAGAKSKKVAVSFDGYTTNGPTRLRIAEWDLGSIKSGSSGSPFFNQDGRVIGVVSTGGPDSDCPSVNVGFARFDASWTGGGAPSSRLRDWLDPTKSNALTIPGRENIAACDLLPWPSGVTVAAGVGGGSPLPGSSQTLGISITNAGDATLTDLVGTLSTDTPGVTIETSVASWPPLLPGETEATDAPHFSYSVGPLVPCGTEIVFKCEIEGTGGAGSWTPELRVRVGGASVSAMPLSSFYLSESITGSNAFELVTSDPTPEGLQYFIPDIETASDTALVSGLVFVPDHAKLRFRQRIDAENIYGGGLVELRTLDSAGGPGDWIDAGLYFESGGYASGLAWTVPSDLRNRPAYGGDSDGWQDATIDLTPFAGLLLEVRWRYVTDDSGGDVGWWIDDAIIETTSYDCVID